MRKASPDVQPVNPVRAAYGSTAADAAVYANPLAGRAPEWTSDQQAIPYPRQQLAHVHRFAADADARYDLVGFDWSGMGLGGTPDTAMVQAGYGILLASAAPAQIPQHHAAAIQTAASITGDAAVATAAHPAGFATPVGNTGVAATATLTSAANTKSMPSPTQLITFGDKTPVQLSSTGFQFTIPSSFYQQKYDKFSIPLGGFTAYGKFNIAGGIKGSVTASFGTVLPDYPLQMNAEAPGYVQDGNIFTVDPTLVATDDADFTLALPTLDASLAFGLTASGGVGIQFPSVQIGVTVFGQFIGYTFQLPSLYEPIVSVGSIQHLATDKTENFTGGYATVSELKPANYTSTTSGVLNFALPTLTGTGYTAPFLSAQFDPVLALSQYVPELKALDGGESFGIGSASWSLLSLPIDASLQLANSETLTPDGFSVTGYETVDGNKVRIGTKSVETGGNVGSAWTLTSPSTGAGAIDLTLDYALTLTEQSAVSLFGSFGVTLDGPQASATIAGLSFGFGPAFSLDLVNLKGALLTYDLPTQQITLTGTQHDLVFYGTSQVVQTLTGNSYSGYTLKAGGELFKLAAGSYIAPVTNAPISTIGILGTLGAAGIYNYGTIFPNVTHSSFTNGSIGIDLPGGGKILNAGDINYGVAGAPQQLNFKGNIQFGILAGGPLTTITNTGKIVGVGVGIEITGANTYGFVYNTGFIDAAYQDIYSQSALVVHNSGTLWGTNSRDAVLDKNSLLFYNLAGGVVDGSGAAAIVSTKQFSFLENQGLVGERAGATSTQDIYGVVFASGEVDNRGTIIGSVAGVVLGATAVGSCYLQNSGVIETTGTSGFAAILRGKYNTVEISPGAKFIGGGVYARPGSQNLIILGDGTGVGTLADTSGFAYGNFGRISIDKGAAWNLETTVAQNFGGGASAGSATISGLTQLDLITFTDAGFTYGEHANLQVVNATSAVLSLVSAGGSTIDSVHLGGKFAGENTYVTASGTGSAIRVFAGNFTNIVHGTHQGLAITAHSYYGGRLTIASYASVNATLAGYPTRSYGLDFQPVTNINTATVGGVRTVTTAAVPALLTNYGKVVGGTYGVRLETNGMIGNKLYGSITGGMYGIDQVSGPSGLLVGNAGTITGGSVGIQLGEGGTVANAAGAKIAGGAYGVRAAQPALVVNAGVINGSSAIGVQLQEGGVVYNVAGGTITGQLAGVSALGTTSNVTNAGRIIGGIVLGDGGGVVNSFGTAGGTTHVGTITGQSYGIVIQNAAGSVQNETGLTSGAFGDGVIAGISLAQGGILTNGEFGNITDGTHYAVRMGGIGTVLNAGTIGAIDFAGPAGYVANAAGATIASITAASLTVQNAGTIGGAGLAAAPINVTGALYIDNLLGVIEGANGVVLLAGQTLVNAAGGTVRGYGAGNAGVVLDGGTLIEAGSIAGENGAAAITFGAQTATLTLLGGAQISGVVNTNATAGDALVLAGPGGSLAGIGTSFAGFAHSTLDAGSVWTLASGSTLTGNWTVAGTFATGHAGMLAAGLTAVGTETVSGAIDGANGYGSFETGRVYGATALAITGGMLTNIGAIQGGYGAHYGYSGDGVDLSGGTLINTGLVSGGSYSSMESSGAGGTGVSVTSAVVINSGLIEGGDGNNQFSFQGYGGGVGLILKSGTVINTGTIRAGNSRYYGTTGAYVNGGTLDNYGQITGSVGTTASGYGVALVGGTLLNGGTISGGNGAPALAIIDTATLELGAGYAFNGGISIASGVQAGLLLGGTVLGTFSSLYSGGFTGFSSFGVAAGADWVLEGTAQAAGNAQIDGTLTIAGSLSISGDWTTAVPLAVTGSLGITGSVTGQLTDGAVAMQAGLLSNAGLIAGGAGYYNYNSFAGTAGGTGLAQSGGTVSNTGMIEGGAGARCSGDAPAGGIGVSLSNGGLVNAGTILGGAGMYGGGAGGNGGAGVVMTGGTLTDSGLIAGGTGGYSYYYASTGFTGTPGNGGAGVYLAGGTLVVYGTVAGGAAGTIINKAGVSGARGDAVQFGAGPATLELKAGAVFDGLVVGNTAVRDVLQLSGTTAGTLTGLGTEFLGISALMEGPSAHWTLAGSQSFAGTGTFAGALTLAGTLLGASQLTLATAGRLLSSGGSLGGSLDDLGHVTLSAGTLDIGGVLSVKGGLRINTGALVDVAGGGTLSGGVSGLGTLELQNGAVLAGAVFADTHLRLDAGVLKGAGKLAALVNDGTVEASGGTLTLLNHPTGTGSFIADAGATLAMHAGGTITNRVSGAGTLALTAGVATFAGGLITTGAISVALGAGLVTVGTLAGAITDLGTITVTHDQLTLDGAVSGTGAIVADAGTKITLKGGGSAGVRFSGAGTIDLAAATTLTHGAALSATYTDVSANLAFGANTSLINAAGDELVLGNTSKSPIAISGAAGDTLTNSGTAIANGSGNIMVGVSFINRGDVLANAGTLTLAAVTNAGTLQANARLAVTGAITGTGSLAIGAGGVMNLLGSVAASQSLSFLGNTGTLEIGNALDFHAMISGLQGADAIDLVNLAATTLSYAKGVLTVENGTTTVAALHISGTNLTTSSFKLASDHHGGSLITFG